MSEKTTAGQSVPSNVLLGLGVRIIPDEHAFVLLFEVEGMATDSKGNRCPAGLSMKIGVKPECALKTVSHYEQFAAAVAAQGWPEFDIGPGRGWPVTWDYYCEQGYNDEN